MTKKGEDKMGMGDERKEALNFMCSLRGQYILAQALYVAAETLKKVDEPFTELSNIADMEYLMDNVFPMFKQLKGSGVDV
jgi:hypothetical protein